MQDYDMAKYCQPDRTPCDLLITQLGVSIFGEEDSQRFFILTTDRLRSSLTPIPLEYCPFCGCRLAELPFYAGERIKLPSQKKQKRRKSLKRAKATLDRGEEEPRTNAAPSFPSPTRLG